MGMGQSEFLSYVRENGLDKDINRNEVGEYLKADAGFSTISGFTDYAGAMYAGLEQRITKDFSGEEQAAQLKKLNECFNSAVQEYTNSYEEQLTAVYGEFGANLDEFKIKASVTNLFAEKRDSYREFAKQNTDYAKLSQSEDKWLERDVKFMTSALRNAHSPDEAESSIYSESDLKALGYMASQHEEDSMSYNMGSRFTEENLGLCAYVTWLKNIRKNNYTIQFLKILSESAIMLLITDRRLKDCRHTKYPNLTKRWQFPTSKHTANIQKNELLCTPALKKDRLES